MTSIKPGKSGKKFSRRRAVGAAALVTVVGVGGWAGAGNALGPVPEPESRAVQLDGPPGAPSGTAGSAAPESVPSGSEELESAPAPASVLMPASTRSESVPSDPETKASGTPGVSGKIINEPPPVAVAKGFDKAADVASGVSVRVSGRKAVPGEARGVGEVAGPAVQFTLTVTNRTPEPVSLAEAVVNVETGSGRVPAELLSGPGAVAFPAEVAPGQTVSGVFVFRIPPDQRGAVRVLFHYQAVTPVAAFEGSAPVQGEAP